MPEKGRALPLKAETPLRTAAAEPDAGQRCSNEPKRRIRLFLSCAPEDAHLVAGFERHLPLLERAGVTTSHESIRRNNAATESEVSASMEASDIILFFLSAAYLASIHSEREMRFALEQRHKRDVVIIPVLLRACLWQSSVAGVRRGATFAAQARRIELRQVPHGAVCNGCNGGTALNDTADVAP